MNAQVTRYEEGNGGEIPVIACLRNPHGMTDEKGYYGQLTFSCPFCGKQHFHGAGGPNPGDGDGHRCEHCQPGTAGAERGYILEEIKNPHEVGHAGGLPSHTQFAAQSWLQKHQA